MTFGRGRSFLPGLGTVSVMSGFRDRSPDAGEEHMHDFLRARPRGADVAVLGWDRARLAALTRLVNCIVVAAGIAIVLSRIVPVEAAEARLDHWPSEARDLVIVDRTNEAAWQEATQYAVQEWNRAGAGVRLAWAAGAGTCEPDGVNVAICRAPGEDLKGFVDYQGLTTQGHGEDGHASEAVIEVCGDCGLDAADRRVVATHEIGHMLGLTHNQRLGSIMFPSGGTDRLDDGDVAALRRLYAHEDQP